MAADALREHIGFAWRLLAWTIALSLLSYLAARAQPNQGYVPIWPSGGVGLALIWRHGARYWPAIVVSSTALSMSVGTSPLIALGVGALQLLIVMVTVQLLQRWQVSTYLSDMRQLGCFILALLVATALAVPIYGLRMALVFQYPPRTALAFGADYFLSALLSSLIFTPLLVSWPAHALANRARLWWFAGGMLAIAVVGWTVLFFEDANLQDRLLFLMLPFVVMCALAARIGGASAAAALLAMVMIAMARAPVAITDSILRTLFALIAALTGYLLAALFTERGRSAAEMDYRARHDSLTGLMNRYEFENRVVAALRDSAQQYQLLYLDLDQFKLINDTCGHLAGDHMLRQVARTIRDALPTGAMLARLGGDEFGCLLGGASTDEALAVAERLHAAIGDFEFLVGALRFKVGVSIGATSLVASNDQRANDALARADVACYAAKEGGRNRTRLYSPADRDMHGRHSDMQRISQLLSDLESGMFELYAQRIINLRDPHDGMHFYEVLLRSKQQTDESIEAVLEMAQRYGLLAQVDRWVLEESARFLQSAAAANLRLSVNIGATTLDSEGFLQFALALPSRYAFSAARIVLEITEAVAVKNLTHAGDTLRVLRERGYEIALDDFGAGVASFGYLSDLPVSMVKIDGRFVRDFDHDPTAEVVVASLTRVASLRGIRCVAEWVENLAVLPRLRELGIGYAQGFAIHKPEPLVSIELGVVTERVSELA